MKLITLNTWGGKLLDPFLTFLKEYSNTIDIFCLQEVYSSPENRKIGRDMQSNLFQQISSILTDYQGFYKPNLKGCDLEGKVDFELWSGLALFINKTITIKETGEIWLYREGCELLNGDNKTVARNLQYINFINNNEEYTVGHFHGVWYPKSKLDNPERIEQCKRIKAFFDARTGKKILCGDFNLLPTTESMKILEEGRRNLIKEFNIKTTRTEHYEREEKHADYVLVTPNIQINEFKTIDLIISDHLPLYFDFT